METKICKKCNKDLTINHFYLSRGKPVNTCKDCDKLRIKENYKKNPEKKIQQSRDRYSKIKVELNKKKRQQTIEKNKDVICIECFNKFDKKKKDQIYCSLNCWRKAHRREHLNEYQYKARELYNKNKSNKEYLELKHKLQKRYYENNKEKINKKTIQYHLQRYKTDPIFNLIHKLRRRINKTLKTKNIEKHNNWNSAYGCSPYELKQHIEKQFTKGMSWDKVFNGEIHIDHITPISLADTEDEVYLLNNYTNLQPLWAEDNLKKGDKISY